MLHHYAKTPIIVCLIQLSLQPELQLFLSFFLSLLVSLILVLAHTSSANMS